MIWPLSAPLVNFLPRILGIYYQQREVDSFSLTKDGILGYVIHRMKKWRTTRSSPGTSHESEASEASVSCFDNASPEKSCFLDGLVCFISLCLLVFVFLNASRRDRNCPTFASTGKQWIHGIRRDEGSEYTIAAGTEVCSLHFKVGRSYKII